MRSRQESTCETGRAAVRAMKTPLIPNQSNSNKRVSIRFEIFRGHELWRTETLSQDLIKIGKLPSSHLRIEDEHVSRMHAVIEINGPDAIFIIDLGSPVGTVVNGQKVSKSKLESGDEI